MFKKVGHGRTFKVLVMTSSIGFICFYLLAASHYPGGSDLDKHSVSFSWTQNYWCDLLSTYTKNGRINRGKTYAVISMIFLNLTFISSWVSLGKQEVRSSLAERTIIISGFASTIFTNFIASPKHDLFISFSVVFGLIAIARVLKTQRTEHILLFYTGLFGGILILLNCLVYFFQFNVSMLPLLQKITFAYMLMWFNVSVTR